MSVRLQVIIAVVVVVALAIIINMIRKKSLELRYALAWLLAGVGIFILDLFPGVIEWLAKLLGIASPVNMLFFLGFCFSLCIVFVLTIAVSRMSIRIKELTQELAMFEEEDSREKSVNK